MSERVRDDNGQYSGKLTRQDLLKVFDYETTPAEPMLKVSEIVEALAAHFDIHVSSETVRRRLTEMEADDEVASKAFGASAKGWTALVGPELSPAVSDAANQAADEGEFTPLEEVADDLDVDLD